MRILFALLLLILTLPASQATGQVSVPWTYTNGPLAGRIQCFVWTEDGAMYIGTDASGIYRSTDGSNWKRAVTGLGEQNVQLMAVEPDGDLLALTYVRPNPAGVPPVMDPTIGHLYRSTNAGGTWTAVDTIEVWSLLVDKQGNIWRGFYTQDNGSWYLRSTNGGTVWERKIPTPIDVPNISHLAMDSSGALYIGMRAGGTKGTFKSTTAGNSWTTFVPNVMLEGLTITKGGYIFGIDSPHKLVRVKTDGSGYTVLDSNFTASRFAFLANGSVYAVEPDGRLIRSTNNGVSWTSAAAATYGALRVYSPDGISVFMTALKGRLFRASGRDWIEVSDDLRNTFVPSLLCTRAGSIYAGTQLGIWRATNTLGSWFLRTEATWHATFPPNYVWSMAEGSNGFIASVAEGWGLTPSGQSPQNSAGNVATTSDDWVNVQESRTGYEGGLGGPLPTQAKIKPYAVTVGAGDTAYLAGEPMMNYRGFAKFIGGTYTALAGPLTGKTVYALAHNAQDTLFAGTGGSGVYRSATHGTTWAEASNGLTDLNVYALATDAAGRVFAGTGSGLFISKNSGASWTAAPGGPASKIQAVATNSEGHVYVATTDYVWMSATHGSAPWYRLNSGLPMADIRSIAIHPDGDVYAGTWGRGVYHRPAWPNAPSVPAPVYPANLASDVPQNPVCRWNTVPGAESYHLQISTVSTFTSTVFDDSTLTDTSKAVTLTGAGTYYWRVCARNVAGTSAYSAAWKFSATLTTVAGDPGIPTAYFLDQNHPNPFNPSTLIRYGLPEKANVRLVVYSTLGQEVAVLTSGEQDAGYHESRFDARGLASGVYLYRLEAGTYVQVRKLVLLR